MKEKSKVNMSIYEGDHDGGRERETASSKVHISEFASKLEPAVGKPLSY